MPLTERQEQVVNTQGHCACIALPGSGKSHTCVQYIVKQIELNSNCYIVVITFTRKAAKEIKDRIIKEVGNFKYLKHIRVSTFDSLFIQQLKAASSDGKVRIISSPERYNLIIRSLSHLGSKWKIDRAIEAVDYFSGLNEIPQSAIDKNPDGYDIFEQYEEFRRNKKLWDFPSISKAVVRGQETGAIPLLAATNIVVDEFQDTSSIQYNWLLPYGRSGKTACVVVGDDDQSIYSWRGGNGYENFVQFKAHFKPTIHVLDLCFRCKPNILAISRHLIEYNQNRVNKEMKSLGESGGIVKLVGSIDKGREIDAVIQKLKEAENHTEWAILSRTNRQLIDVAAMLSAENIPYRTRETESLLCRPFSDMIYKIAVTCVRETKMHCPDIISWLGGTESEIELSRQYGGLSRRFSIVNYQLPNDQKHPELLSERLFLMVRDFLNEEPTIDEGLNKIRSLIIFRDNTKADLKVLDILLYIIGSMEGLSFFEALKAFVKMVEKAQKTKNDNEVEAEGVELLTLHSSKGLQWPKVWIMGVNDGVLPAEIKNNPYNALKNEFEYHEYIAACESEERRLLYVGMTRAMDELYISFLKGAKSVFIYDIEAYNTKSET